MGIADEDMLDRSELCEAPKRKLLEKDIENAVVKYAQRCGWRALKFVSPNYRSVPDRIFFKYPVRVFFIEFKRPGEKPTPKQELEIARLKKEGFDVFVVDSVDHGKFIIDMMG